MEIVTVFTIASGLLCVCGVSGDGCRILAVEGMSCEEEEEEAIEVAFAFLSFFAFAFVFVFVFVCAGLTKGTMS